MSDQMKMQFDPEVGEHQKQAGMGIAADNRSLLLQVARNFARELGRFGGIVDADMVQRRMIETIPDYSPEQLGNAMGSLFKGGEWEPTGEFKKSERVSNHRRLLYQWRLRR